MSRPTLAERVRDYLRKRSLLSSEAEPIVALVEAVDELWCKNQHAKLERALAALREALEDGDRHVHEEQLIHLDDGSPFERDCPACVAREERIAALEGAFRDAITFDGMRQRIPEDECDDRSLAFVVIRVRKRLRAALEVSDGE